MMKYCSECGKPTKKCIPDGDNRYRHVCHFCHSIHYTNPKIIVGTVCFFERRILLCRRAIAPRIGFWTIPAGFMEDGETSQQGAFREAKEEANVSITQGKLLAIYEIPHINQVQIVYLANLLNLNCSPGTESLETKFFEQHEIPIPDLAFRSVNRAINQGFQALSNPHLPVDQQTLAPDPFVSH